MAPSLKTGSENVLVVTISTTRPVSASAFWKRSSVASRVASSGSRSSSWKVTAAAPSSASLYVASTGSSSGRLAGPKTSTPCQPTVQRPKENLSSGRGVKSLTLSFMGRDLLPGTGVGAGLDGRQHPLHLEPVGEGRRGLDAPGDRS